MLIKINLTRSIGLGAFGLLVRYIIFRIRANCHISGSRQTERATWSRLRAVKKNIEKKATTAKVKATTEWTT